MPRACVDCSATMHEDELGPVRVDVCRFGHGVWFENGELAALLTSFGQQAQRDTGLLRTQLAGDLVPDERERFTTNKELICPSCESVLKRREYPEWSGIFLDVCTDGVWAEQAEILQLAAWAQAQRTDDRDTFSDIASLRADLASQEQRRGFGAWLSKAGELLRPG